MTQSRRIKRSGSGKKITRKPAGVKTETVVKTKPAPKSMKREVKPNPPRVDFASEEGMNEYQIEWPNYQPFPYEQELARKEWAALTGAEVVVSRGGLRVKSNQPLCPSVVRRVAFSHRVSIGDSVHETTIAQLEKSGLRARYGTIDTTRKESNYLTHGLHRYKGKFYPQLARALLNISGVKPGALVLDPFMGSGTTILEAWLTGVDSIGFDISPLAHLVARTKVSALKAGYETLRKETEGLVRGLLKWTQSVGIVWPGPHSRDETAPCRLSASQFALAVGRPKATAELSRWFPPSVIEKLYVVVKAVDEVKHPTARDFFRVCLSDIVRPVSQQEPRDLRTRRRAEPIDDAPVLRMFLDKIEHELLKISLGENHLREAPPDSWPQLGDIRTIDVARHVVLRDRMVDAVVSSPPYSTALPYIDTDRLSFIVLGLTSPRERSRLQKGLIGTREIDERTRRSLEDEMVAPGGLDSLPSKIKSDLRYVLKMNTKHEVGFRRRNTPALLYQYFRDMRISMRKVARMCRAGAPMYLVLGDSKTTLGNGELFSIRTCEHIGLLSEQAGFKLEGTIPITVTTEDLAHSKNSITENRILVLRRSSN